MAGYPLPPQVAEPLRKVMEALDDKHNALLKTAMLEMAKFSFNEGFDQATQLAKQVVSTITPKFQEANHGQEAASERPGSR